MKKAIIILTSLILLVATTGLFAEAQKESASGKTKLTMYHLLNLTESTAQNFTDVILPTFKEANPDIEIEAEYLFNEPYHNKLQAMSVADTLPDIIFLWPGKRTGQVTGNGKVKDLRPWLTGHEAEFSSMAMAAQGPNGEIWELPEQVTATHVMFTNDKLLKDLGLPFPNSFEELLAQGDVIRGAGLIPIGMDNKDGWEMQSCLASALVERAAGQAWYDDIIQGIGSFSDQVFVDALNIIKILSDEEMFSPGINQADYGQAMNAFVNEEAVYFIDGGWRANNLVTELTDAQKQYISFRTMPDIPNQKGVRGSTSAVAGTGFGMNAKLSAAKADQAWKWIWFYSGPVGSKIRQGFGALPAYNLPVPGDADPMVKALADFIANTPMTYVLDAVLDAEGMGVFNPGLQEMMMGSKTPQQVADQYEAWVAANDTSRK
jgi:raffinose/stachyose/melibiose transport system substrate-binding protein